MIWTHFAAAIVAAALAGWAGWQVQAWRLGEQIAAIKSDQLEAVNTATREARAQESARFTNVQEAQHAATKRAQTARLDADRARTELDRLRDQLATFNLPAERIDTLFTPNAHSNDKPGGSGIGLPVVRDLVLQPGVLALQLVERPHQLLEIVADEQGRPGARLAGEVAAWASERGIGDVDVSITHDRGTALGIASVRP